MFDIDPDRLDETALPWQKKVLHSNTRHHIVVGGRRIGMSSLALAAARITFRFGQQPLIVMPNRHVAQPIRDIGLPVRTPLSHDLPDLVPDLLIVDGLTYISPDEMPDVLMLISRSRRLLLMGTPIIFRGRKGEVDWLRFFYQMAGHQSDWARWHVPMTEVVGKTISAEQVDELKRAIPQSEFRAEILAEWVEIV